MINRETEMFTKGSPYTGQREHLRPDVNTQIHKHMHNLTCYNFSNNSTLCLIYCYYIMIKRHKELNVRETPIIPNFALRNKETKSTEVSKIMGKIISDTRGAFPLVSGTR